MAMGQRRPEPAALATTLEGAAHLVDLALASTESEAARGFYATLRAAARARGVVRAGWESESASLEGRLRQHPALEADASAPRLVEALFDVARVPWFLVRDGITAGVLRDDERSALAGVIEGLARALPEEVTAFGRALGEMAGRCLVHEGLDD